MTIVYKDKVGNDIRVGDIVTCSPYMSHHDGKLSGMVMMISSDGYNPHPIGVDFGIPLSGYHNLSGNLPRRTGYRFPAKSITVENNRPLLGDDDEDCV